MKEKLAKIQSDALEQIHADGADLEQIKIKYLGKKGELTAEEIKSFLEKNKSRGGYKPWVLFGLMVSSATFAALCMEDVGWFKLSFVGEIKQMFTYGADGFGGGLIGSTIARLL